MEKKRYAIIEKANEFVELYENLSYIIKPEAREIKFDANSMIGGILTEEFYSRSLAEWLSDIINDYIWCKENYNFYKDSKDAFIRLHNSAKMCLMWKTKAISHGLLIEGSSFAQRLKEYQEKNAELEKKLQEISDAYQDLQRKYEELQSQYEELGEKGKRWFQADVTKK